MNWKKLILVGSVALGALSVSANAASRAEATTIRTQPAHRSVQRSGSSFRHWNSFNRYRWHYNPYSFYFGGGYGYPYGGYYGSGFGYSPYGYGGGFGYRPYGYDYYSTGQPYYQRVTGGSLVARVQQRLAQAGYYRGSIDGVAGYGTRSAIRAYERDHGLRVDGVIDRRLLTTMGVA